MINHVHKVLNNEWMNWTDWILFRKLEHLGVLVKREFYVAGGGPGDWCLVALGRFGLVSGLVWFDFLYDLNFTALKFDWTFQIERCGDLWMWVSKVDLTLDRIPILERELLGLM